MLVDSYHERGVPRKGAQVTYAIVISRICALSKWALFFGVYCREPATLSHSDMYGNVNRETKKIDSHLTDRARLSMINILNAIVLVAYLSTMTTPEKENHLVREYICTICDRAINEICKRCLLSRVCRSRVAR